jgi:ABC-type antimicrobial peptide transport system permease subunit
LFVYATGSPDALLHSITTVAHGLAPDLVLNDATTVPDIIARALWAPRLGAGLLAAFGALALLLASVGIYGVVSYSVTQRVRELGIRMALGAQPVDVLRQVLREGMQLVAWGLLFGWVGAFYSTRGVAKLLFGVRTTDLTTFAGVSALFAAVALLACYVPARRATRIDPMLALRVE